MKTKKQKGYLAFVLHAHLPYVRHPEHESFLEERWFFEAVTETYLPLIKFFNRLVSENVRFGLTLSISPSLLAMMEDALLRERYATHLKKLIELAEKEEARTRGNPHLNYLARIYQGLFAEAWHTFAGCDGRLASAFKKFHEQGVLELITTCATHGLLPLLAPHPKAVKAQLHTGLDYFKRVFGFESRGLWLPECGYFRGLEDMLPENGIRYFVLESHGIEHAGTTPFYGVYAPLYTPSGVAAFGRDRGSTKQVWSAREGFPGDPVYREFYRDIGHDLDWDYIHPYTSGPVRADTGIKYHRITGISSPWKDLYHPDWATQRAAEHAEDFLQKRIGHIEHLSKVMGTAPVIVAPFDAELFGHWWFEGPQWLDFVIRKAAFDQDTLELVTLSEYLDRHPVQQLGEPCSSSWGHKGYFEAWLNGKTDWIYPQIYECSRRMESLAGGYGAARSVPFATKRALNQCVRELLLAQSSDWPFIINNATSEGYALRRIKDHVARFRYLADSIEGKSVDEEYLSAIEEIDNIFPNADYRVFL